MISLEEVDRTYNPSLWGNGLLASVSHEVTLMDLSTLNGHMGQDLPGIKHDSLSFFWPV